jgi:WD40 repeat protein
MRSRGSLFLIAVASLIVLSRVVFIVFSALVPPASPDASKARTSVTGHSDRILELTFSEDGTRLFSASMDSTARVWDSDTGREIARVTANGTCPYAAKAPCRVTAAAFSKDHSQVALFPQDSDVEILSIPAGSVVRHLPLGRENGFGSHDSIVGAAFSSDGSKLAWGTRGGGSFTHYLYLWSAASAAKPAELENARGVAGLCFSPDQSKLALLREVNSSGRTNFVMLDAATSKELYRVENVSDFRFSQDGAAIWVESGPEQQQLELIEAGTGRVLRSLHVSTRIAEFALSPDASKVIVTGEDGTVQVWEAARAKLLSQFNTQVGRTVTVAFSHSASIVLTAGEDHKLRLWNLEDGHQTRLLEGPQDGVESAVFSPDDSRVAVTTPGYHIWIWDLKTGKSLEAR